MIKDIVTINDLALSTGMSKTFLLNLLAGAKFSRFEVEKQGNAYAYKNTNEFKTLLKLSISCRLSNSNRRNRIKRN